MTHEKFHEWMAEANAQVVNDKFANQVLRYYFGEKNYEEKRKCKEIPFFEYIDSI